MEEDEEKDEEEEEEEHKHEATWGIQCRFDVNVKPRDRGSAAPNTLSIFDMNNVKVLGSVENQGSGRVEESKQSTSLMSFWKNRTASKRASKRASKQADDSCMCH